MGCYKAVFKDEEEREVVEEKSSKQDYVQAEGTS